MHRGRRRTACQRFASVQFPDLEAGCRCTERIVDMHNNVIVRSEADRKEEILKVRTGETWEGVDHGVVLLLEAGIVPEYSYGDFDSITEEEREFITGQLDIDPVPAEKDDTDLALCLGDLVKKGYSTISVFGATGGRMDHALGNIQLLMHED